MDSEEAGDEAVLAEALTKRLYADGARVTVEINGERRQGTVLGAESFFLQKGGGNRLCLEYEVEYTKGKSDKKHVENGVREAKLSDPK